MEKHTERIGNHSMFYVYNKINEIKFLKPVGTGEEKKNLSGGKRTIRKDFAKQKLCSYLQLKSYINKETTTM